MFYLVKQIAVPPCPNPVLVYPTCPTLPNVSTWRKIAFPAQSRQKSPSMKVVPTTFPMICYFIRYSIFFGRYDHLRMKTKICPTLPHSPLYIVIYNTFLMKFNNLSFTIKRSKTKVQN